MLSPQKEWFVESQGQIFEADLDELRQWIVEGAVLPSDRVKRGSLRWLAAEKVPELYNFFNSGDYLEALPELTATNIPKFNGELYQTQFCFDGAASEEAFLQATEAEKICYKHKDLEAVFACDVCKNFFCKTCPNSYGSVKICPVCSGLCRHVSEQADIHKSIGAINKPYLKIDADLNDYGKQTQNGFHASNVIQFIFHQNSSTLVLAVIVFSLILSGAYFILFWLK
jgi:hypothetical protein